MLTPPAHALRVLITADAVGGIWRHALDLASELTRRGAAVCIVTWGPRPAAHQRSEAAAASIETIHVEAPLDWLGGEAALELAARRLDTVIRSWSPSVVHLNVPALAPRLTSANPCVAVLHSCLATWWMAVRRTPLPDAWQWHARATGDGLAAADVAISPSAAFADAMATVYGRLARLRVIHNASGARPPRPKEPFAFAAGRWWDDGKNAACLDAAAALARSPVRVAGPLRAPHGDERRFDRARWLGDLPHGRLLGEIDRAAVFVSAALYEPFGLSVLEAASAGSALVLADIPTFRELWQGCAHFVSPDDPRRLARTIDALMDDPQERRRLGEAARARSAWFSIDRQAEAFLRAYGLALSTRRRAA